MNYKDTRACRNNNPFNIKRSATRWQGERKEVHDKTFAEFESVRYGIRAAWLILRRYISIYHLYSVRQIIERWAPASENNVDRYVHFIESQYHIDYISCDKDFRFLLTAIAWYESAYALTYTEFWQVADEFMLSMPIYPK